MTFVPADTARDSCSASQFVRRTQPWLADFPMSSGVGVPWIPYPSLDRSIQVDPTGLFGPAAMVSRSSGPQVLPSGLK